MLTATVGLISTLGTVRAGQDAPPIHAAHGADKNVNHRNHQASFERDGEPLPLAHVRLGIATVEAVAGGIPMREAKDLVGSLPPITGPAAESRC